MTQLEKLLAAIRNNPRGVRFHDAAKVAGHYFGPPRVRGSHNVYTMPWASLPRVNLQDVGGYVESYQVTQLLEAIDKLAAEGTAAAAEGAASAAAEGTAAAAEGAAAAAAAAAATEVAKDANEAEDEHDDKQA